MKPSPNLRPGSFFATLAGLALASSPAFAAYTLVDNFQGYTVGTYSGGSTAFVANGGPWQSSNGGATGLVSIENSGSTLYLAHGWNSGTSGDPNVLGTQIANDFGFRNGAAANNLVTFLTLSNNHEDNNANLDNIHFNSAAVPEPSATLLGGLGLLGCFIRRRR